MSFDKLDQIDLCEFKVYIGEPRTHLPPLNARQHYKNLSSEEEDAAREKFATCTGRSSDPQSMLYCKPDSYCACHNCDKHVDITKQPKPVSTAAE